MVITKGNCQPNQSWFFVVSRSSNSAIVISRLRLRSSLSLRGLPYVLAASVRKAGKVSRTRDGGASQPSAAAQSSTEEIPASKTVEVPLENAQPDPTAEDPTDSTVDALLANVGSLSDWIAFHGGACHHSSDDMMQVEQVITLAVGQALGLEPLRRPTVEAHPLRRLRHCGS